MVPWSPSMKTVAGLMMFSVIGVPAGAGADDVILRLAYTSEKLNFMTMKFNFSEWMKGRRHA
ncbi:hypothetical protein ANT2_3443 [plant metagenome]|uniref:Uncharacterized protein n=2 Tax=plant metagenome TaxID=1297885 RepID=A0A484QY07_9ZZZZ